MAETPNGRVAMEPTTDRTSPSTEEMKAAIRETRNRLAVRLARTADHVHVLFTTPSSVETEARDGGVVGGAIRTIGVAGRAKRVWSDARGRAPPPSSDRRRDGGHRGRARDEETTSLTTAIEQPEDDMPKKSQKRTTTKRARPAGKDCDFRAGYPALRNPQCN